MSEMLEAARRYVAAGLSVAPVRRWSKSIDFLALGHPAYQPLDDATKTTLFAPYTERMPTDADLRHWFADTNCGLAIVGGAVSGGLVRLDFEHKACLDTWFQILQEDRDLFLAAAVLPIVRTGKGHHVYFRMADPPGHVVLCAHGTGDDAIVFSETQGEGCYCLAPPTKHINDQGLEFNYTWCSTLGPEAIPTLDQELASKLIEAARFPGFWEPAFAAHYGPCTGQVSRGGMSIADPGRRSPGFWLGWEHVTALHAYLDRYGGLLKAVETAPPPPPSYVEDDSDGWS